MSNIPEVIKYEGDNSTFIWKHPCEDFTSLTQLIVHESQEAIFFMNGEAVEVFTAGRYTLTTENIPKIGRILRRQIDGENPFHCEVYFINQTVQMDLKWGTDSKVRYIEPEYQVPLDIGASGSLNLKVLNGQKLLLKLVGTMNGIAWNESGENFTKSLQQSFRPMISTAVKSHLGTVLKEQRINLLEIDSHLNELSAGLREKILPGFEEYGLTVPNFYLTTVVLPEDDPNFQRIRQLLSVSLRTQGEVAEARKEAEVLRAKREGTLEAETTKTEVAKREAEREIIAAQAEAEKIRQAGFAEAEVMQAQGITKKDYVQAEVQKAYAEGIGNMGSGGGGGGASPMTDIIGLGVGLQAAQAMSGQIGGIFGGITGNQQNAGTPAAGAASPAAQESVKCASCGAVLPPNAKFCLECGGKVVVLSENEIICPECGAKTPKGKFCMECGASLVNKCPDCGTEVPLGAKFCPECGKRF